MNTKELAKIMGVKPESIIAGLSRHKSYYGLVPETMPNGRLSWPDDALEQMRAYKDGGLSLEDRIKK